MKVEFWDCEYKGGISLLKRIEDFPNDDEGFKKFYHENNRYKYCNGTHYKFVNKEDSDKYYNEFFKKYHTIENYYQGGIVD